MYFLGLDIGTTGAKAVIADERGRVLKKGYRGYPLVTDGCKIEQDARLWASCGFGAIADALSGTDVRIEAVSLSTQGASTAPFDSDMQPLSLAWTWMDYRSQQEAEELSARFGADFIYQTSGWRAYATLDAAKIMRMRRELGRPAAKYLSTVDYMNWALTGNAVIDPTNAAIRQLFSVKEGDWEEDILSFIGITRDNLAQVALTGTPVGVITAQAAAATGLTLGTPVYNGAHDQYCASVGSGCVSAGDMLLSAGTTWVVMGIGNAPIFSDTFIAPAKHPMEGLYGNMASLAGSGVSLEWFKNNFTSEDYRALDDGAKARRQSMGDLFFYPYLAGANYPIWNHAAKGAFTGLTLSHDRFDLALSIMEGVAFGVRRTLDDFAKNGCDISCMTVMGGAAKSPLWRDIIADATNVELRMNAEPDACALGAAIIAAVGAGAFSGYREATEAMVHRESSCDPSGQAGEYAEKYRRYRAMWDAMGGYYGII